MAASFTSQPKTNPEFAAQSGFSGPKLSHSPQPELKRRVANPIGLGKRAAVVANRTGPHTTRNARKGTARNKKQIQWQKKKPKQCIGSHLAVWFNEQFGRRARRHQEQGVQTEPNFFLLSDLKLPDTPFENAESEIGDFLDDPGDEIFHGDLSSEDGFWSPKAYSI